MKYRLRYKIRDWIHDKLFPVHAMHTAHLVDDCIEMAIKIRELEEKQPCIQFATKIITGSNAKTVWVNE